MYEPEKIKFIKCCRCGNKSVILDEESIDDSYCQCGGKNEYIE